MNQNKWDELKAWLLGYKAIDASIETPEKVIRLDLSSHGIEVLPESFGMLTGLIALNLSGNHLQELPQSIESMQHLSNLDLRRNRFVQLPGVITSLPLRSLNLSGNIRITSYNVCYTKLLRDQGCLNAASTR